MGDIEHIKELLDTHVSHMSKRMDEIHCAVMDSTQMVAAHEVRLTVMEKKEGRIGKWASFSGAIGGFISGFISGKVGG